MAGNVWEWCSTRWHDQKQKEYNYPYTPDDGREDLSGGDNIYRVFRGGSWYQDKDASRCAARIRDYPWSWGSIDGFRCCATSSLTPGSES
ncbi:MAG: SUMF1/EgtB/PvdO family nonheme iron enzyme, partial [Chloroflexi bacterium]|nr:SUMF1/EgtB/PvdO family nonheme iron enzyme [Chloroflexota bacterium]